MEEGLMLAVYVAHEVLGALWKAAYGLQLYYLRTGGLYRRELL